MSQKTKFDEKFKLTIIIVWFLISYFIMWFIGGGCTDIFTGGTCFSAEAVSAFRSIPFIGLIFPFNAWISVMYFFAPIAGFVLAYFGLKAYNEYFETKQAYSVFVPAVILIVLLLGYSVNLAWYYGNIAQLNESSALNVELYFCFDEASCQSTVGALNAELQQTPDSSGKITQLLPINYWAELRESMFLTFMLGAIIAWIPLALFNFFENREE